jgi:hypothetical protein
VRPRRASRWSLDDDDELDDDVDEPGDDPDRIALDRPEE